MSEAGHIERLEAVLDRRCRSRSGRRLLGAGWHAAVWGIAALLLPSAAPGQVIPGVSPLCADRPVVRGSAVPVAAPTVAGTAGEPGPASDLYCIDLLPAGAGGDAVGVVELGRVPGPFGISVTADGHHEYDLTAWMTGLPEPTSLGPYTAFVAWATTPVFEPVQRLGEVTEGTNDLGRVDFDKLIVLVTAEASGDATARLGPLILRGRSRSNLMEAHDLLATAPGALVPSGPTTATDQDDAGWTMPPLYPEIDMLPGMRDLVPDATPLSIGSVEGLPEVGPRQLVQLGDGGTLDLEAEVVRRRFGDRWLGMLAFNRQHPGPLIHVTERSTIFVNFTNRTPFPTAVHWHGVRLDNRFDGVPGVTQEAVPPGGSFRYQVYFPDPGIYWYHPHYREDVQQELGLAGNMLVDSRRVDYLGLANREEVLMLDDLLLGQEGVTPFGSEQANYALMGRFGNTLLVNGEPSYALEVDRGEVVRFYLTNASNTRTFNLSFVPPRSDETARVKVVAGDVGKFEREAWASSVVLAPAERYVIDVHFEEDGQYLLQNRVQAIDHRGGYFFPEVATLGTVTVSDRPVRDDYGSLYGSLRENPDVISDIDRYRGQFGRAPDHELVLTMATDGLPLMVEQVMSSDRTYFNPVEWAGTMPMMNWASTAGQVRWILHEIATGLENEAIDWRFSVGDVVKIRLHNTRTAFHAMQHPFHIHGQRFLVLAQNGVANENLVWKDTVLLPAGTTTDILLEVSNPGRWMMHCHIAEHLEAGMRSVFYVEEAP